MVGCVYPHSGEVFLGLLHECAEQQMGKAAGLFPSQKQLSSERYSKAGTPVSERSDTSAEGTGRW